MDRPLRDLNDKTARKLSNALTTDLAQVAKWTAHVLLETPNDSHLVAFDRLAHLYNTAGPALHAWATILTGQNIHLPCAAKILLPSRMMWMPSGVWPCSTCMKAFIPDPPLILREAVAAAVAANGLPVDHGEAAPDYLTKYVFNTLLTRKKEKP